MQRFCAGSKVICLSLCVGKCRARQDHRRTHSQMNKPLHRQGQLTRCPSPRRSSTSAWQRPACWPRCLWRASTWTSCRRIGRRPFLVARVTPSLVPRWPSGSVSAACSCSRVTGAVHRERQQRVLMTALPCAGMHQGIAERLVATHIPVDRPHGDFQIPYGNSEQRGEAVQGGVHTGRRQKPV